MRLPRTHASFLFLLSLNHALGQEGNTPSSPTASGPAAPAAAELSEIVVRTDSVPPIQSVPGSTAALTPGQLDFIAPSSIQSLSQMVPNVSATNPGSRSFNTIFGIRGLTNTQYFSESATAVYLDEIPLGRAFTQSTQLFDLDSLVVLRGPQATLFGQNSEAGVILINTRPAVNELHGSFGASFGNFQEQTYTAAARGALVPDKLFLSISGYSDSRAGYLVNETLNTHPDSQSGIGGKIQLRWTPSPNWEFSLLSMQEYDDDGEQRISGLAGDPFKVRHRIDGKTVVNANTTGLKARYTDEAIEVTSISAYNYWALDPYLVNFGFDPAPEVLQSMHIESRVWSQEVRIRNRADEKKEFTWSGGLFYAHEELAADLSNQITIPTPIGPLGVTSAGRNRTQNDIYAAFGQVSLPLFDHLRASLGARIDYREKKAQSDAIDFSAIRSQESASEDFFNAAPHVGLAYDLNPSSLLYANSSLGFKAGGFVPFQGGSHLHDYDTERAWTSDIGTKKAFFDGKFLINGSFFYTAVRDYQFERFVSPTLYLVTNIPEVHIIGGELEVLAQPLPGVEAGLGFGYSAAIIDELHDPLTGVDHSGNKVPTVPLYKCTAHLQYQHPSGLMARVDSELVGETFYDEANSAYFRQAPYLLTNARVGYTGKYGGLYLFGRNLSDAVYWGFKAGNLGAGTVGSPRSFGIEARLVF